jgi:VanZ family protein
VIRLTIWLPPLVWMAAIMWFSTGDFSADNTASVFGPLLRWLMPWATPVQIDAVHALIRKTAHMTEYGILAVLWFIAFTREGRFKARTAAWAAVLIAVGWACLDELHQAMEPSRTASAMDVGYDAAGALLAMVFALAGWRRAVDGLTTALLWTAAAGGAVVIAVNLASGVGSGLLWLTVPIAAAVLVVRWRRAFARAARRAEG